MNENDKNISLYVFEKTNDEKSLEYQEQRLRKFCDIEGYNIQNVYNDFNCTRDFKREQLNKLLNDVLDGKVDKVLISDPSRISRNYREYMYFVRTLEENNCTLQILSTFDMFKYLGKTTTSLFTLF